MQQKSSGKCLYLKVYRTFKNTLDFCFKMAYNRQYVTILKNYINKKNKVLTKK